MGCSRGRRTSLFPPSLRSSCSRSSPSRGARRTSATEQFVIELAGLAPAILFLVLEKLRLPDARGEVRSRRTERFNAGLALLFAVGTVYFFTAEQGTVWFAAHVVATAVFALYVLFALGAEKPLLAGTFLAFAFATRPPMLLAGALFALEAVRVHMPRARTGSPTAVSRDPGGPRSASGRPGRSSTSPPSRAR